jgi:hypothetical protein
MAAVAALMVAGGAVTAQYARAQGSQAAAPGQKNYKNQAEYAIYSEVTKDFAANNFAKALTDLDDWKQKYPESDFKDNRIALYIQAYAGSNQPAKAVDTAAELLSKDLDAAFSGDPSTAIRVLFTTASSITHVATPTPEELATAEKAAHLLNDYNKKPQGVADAAWAQAREGLQKQAKAALLYIAVLPAEQLMNKKPAPDPQDCVTADAAYVKALADFPDNSYVAFQLGKAMRCQKDKPEKISGAVYEFQRAAVIDPTLGGSADPKTITAFADRFYTNVHGSDEGLEAFKQTVKGAALPPADFKVKTATEIASEKQAEFEKTNPQLALWLKIKGALADSTGDQYFNGQLKDAEVPLLRGTLVDAKPACRSKELLVAIPLPDAKGAPQAEITLKLEAPLTGKPETNTEFQFKGTAAAFTKDPFMLTMDTSKDKLEGLKSSPCAAAPAKKAVHKKKEE